MIQSCFSIVFGECNNAMLLWLDSAVSDRAACLDSSSNTWTEQIVEAWA
jgi:hypothetical protein